MAWNAVVNWKIGSNLELDSVIPLALNASASSTLDKL